MGIFFMTNQPSIYKVHVSNNFGNHLKIGNWRKRSGVAIQGRVKKEIEKRD